MNMQIGPPGNFCNRGVVPVPPGMSNVLSIPGRAPPVPLSVMRVPPPNVFRSSPPPGIRGLPPPFGTAGLSNMPPPPQGMMMPPLPNTMIPLMTNSDQRQQPSPPRLSGPHSMPNFNLPPPGWIPPHVAANVNASQDNSRMMIPPFPVTDFSDLWVENKSPDNKPYYYNAKTRETTWNRPEGVKIITQEELEKMSQFHQQSLMLQQQVYKQEESKNKTSQADTHTTSNTQAQQPSFMPFPRMPFMPQTSEGKTGDQQTAFPPFMQQSGLGGQVGMPPFGFPLPGQPGSFPFNLNQANSQSSDATTSQSEMSSDSTENKQSRSLPAGIMTRKEFIESKTKQDSLKLQGSSEQSDKPASNESDGGDLISAAKSPSNSNVDAKDSTIPESATDVDDTNPAVLTSPKSQSDSQNIEEVQPVVEKCVNASAATFSPSYSSFAEKKKDDEGEAERNKSDMEEVSGKNKSLNDTDSSSLLEEHADVEMTETVNDETGKVESSAMGSTIEVKPISTENERPLQLEVENEMRTSIPMNPAPSIPAAAAAANCMNPSLLTVPPAMFPGAVFPPNTWPPGACTLPPFNFPPLGIHPMQAVGDPSHAFGIPRMPPIFPPFNQTRNPMPTAVDVIKTDATVDDKSTLKFDDQKPADAKMDDLTADISKESFAESDVDLEKLREEYKELETRITALKKEASVWSEYKSPEGKQYFYNSDGMRSQWAKPKVLKDLEAAEVEFKTLKDKIIVEESKRGPPETKELKEIKRSDETHYEAQASSTHEAATIKSEKKELTEEEIAKQRSKPVSSIPVLGTPWCIVWTGNGRVFYYNPTQKLSVWEKPSELIGRTDVEKMVTEPPPEVEAVLGRFAKRKNDFDDDSSTTKKSRTKSTGDNASAEQTKLTITDDDPDKESMDVDETGIARIEIGKEAAIEAEAKAAKERTQIPYDVRVQQFRQMLKEKEVSAFSTWEKELHKIVFDRRYLLLVSKERKAVFEKYVKERAEEERKEKAVKLRKRKDDFKELLKEANVKQSSLFTDFASKYAKDERFRSMEKMRDREQLFNEYISELRKRDREEKNSDHERLKKVYFTLMKEARLDRSNLSWSEAKRLLENDPRYRAIDSSSKKEEWFREFMKQQEDKRYRTDMHEDDDDRARRRDRERQERIDASIRKRQEEVKEQLSGSLREREKERDQLRKVEATENFRVLLMDMVRNADADWRETKKVLKKDGRWELCKLLDKDEKEKIFHEHVCSLNRKKKEAFHQLLAETPEVTLTARWKTVKKAIKHDARFEKFSSNDKKREKEFEEFIREKYLRAKEDFRELLKETKIITYKSYSAVRDSEQNLKDIESILAKDKRYLILDCVPDERKKILCDYLEELELRGPPPPPTASEPSRRK